MDWFVYHIAPIDFGWSLPETVTEAARRLAANDAEFAVATRTKMEDAVHGGMTTTSFLAAWASACDAAKKAGWEGDLSQDPAVFWLPVEDEFQCGFVIKQGNNGSTFVVSPEQLPWLKDNG